MDDDGWATPHIVTVEREVPLFLTELFGQDFGTVNVAVWAVFAETREHAEVCAALLLAGGDDDG